MMSGEIEADEFELEEEKSFQKYFDKNIALLKSLELFFEII